MGYPSSYAHMRTAIFFDALRALAGRKPKLFALFAVVAPVAAFGQGGYVARYDVYAGFAYLHTPSINLSTRGFHIQAAVNTKTWLAMGDMQKWNSPMRGKRMRCGAILPSMR